MDTQYQVIEATSASELANLIARKLKEGWRVQGSVTTSVTEFDIPPNNMNATCSRDLTWRKGQITKYCQAIVK